MADVFQDGEYLGGLMENPGVDLAGGEQPAQVPGLAEVVGEQDQRFILQVLQVHGSLLGQGMVFVDVDGEGFLLQLILL